MSFFFIRVVVPRELHCFLWGFAIEQFYTLRLYHVHLLGMVRFHSTREHTSCISYLHNSPTILLVTFETVHNSRVAE